NATMKSAKVFEKASEYVQLNNTTEVNGFKIGDTVATTVSGKAIAGTITKFKGNWAYVNQANNKKVWVPMSALSKWSIISTETE
ncbi:MAG TPA: hypothetical protein VF691_04280, partial [Cytophagaceae bacterium]